MLENIMKKISGTEKVDAVVFGPKPPSRASELQIYLRATALVQGVELPEHNERPEVVVGNYSTGLLENVPYSPELTTGRSVVLSTKYFLGSKKCCAKAKN